MSIILMMIWLASCALQPTSLPATAVPVTPTALPPLLATLTATTPSLVSEALVSPDGKWQAEVVIYACTMLGDEGEVSYEQLNLRNVATGNQTEIRQQQINCGGLGAYGLVALCWSDDSQLLFFTDAREGVPDGAGEWQRPLYQFNPATGQTQPYTGEVTSAGIALALPVVCQ